MKKVSIEELSYMDEDSLKQTYLRYRSYVNKARKHSKEKKIAEIEVAYILREIEIRKSSMDNFRKYFGQYWLDIYSILWRYNNHDFISQAF